MAQPRATAYSMCLAGVVMDAPRRGVVHSAFATAANLVFPDDVVVSLNANMQPSDMFPRFLPFPAMPNGIQLDGFPFAALRPGMPVLSGAGRLVIDAIGCSLDLSGCSQWDACIVRSANLDMDAVRRNAARLAQEYLSGTDNWGLDVTGMNSISLRDTAMSVAEMARALCGRGRGLTPTGDDMLAGWMAINWLLYGRHARNALLIAACEEIMAVARQQTHVLSQCWLGYAARGCAALPVRALLEALAGDDERRLAAAAQVVLLMGATSGRDLMRGVVMGVQGSSAMMAFDY